MKKYYLKFYIKYVCICSFFLFLYNCDLDPLICVPLDIDDAKIVNVPCERKQISEQDQVALSPSDITKFRSLAARCNYLSPDRPDIQFATKEVCRAMMTPQLLDWNKLKKLVRYLKGCPKVILNFPWCNF